MKTPKQGAPWKQVKSLLLIHNLVWSPSTTSSTKDIVEMTVWRLGLGHKHYSFQLALLNHTFGGELSCHALQTFKQSYSEDHSPTERSTVQEAKASHQALTGQAYEWGTWKQVTQPHSHLAAPFIPSDDCGHGQCTDCTSGEALSHNSASWATLGSPDLHKLCEVLFIVLTTEFYHLYL